jgi:hypothetical protein
MATTGDRSFPPLLATAMEPRKVDPQDAMQAWFSAVFTA